MNRYLFLSLFCGLMGSTAYSAGDVIRVGDTPDATRYPTVQAALSRATYPVTLTFAKIDSIFHPNFVAGTAVTTQETMGTTLPASASMLTLTGNDVDLGAGNRTLTTIEAASPSAAPFPFLRLGSNLALALENLILTGFGSGGIDCSGKDLALTINGNVVFVENMFQLGLTPGIGGAIRAGALTISAGKPVSVPASELVLDTVSVPVHLYFTGNTSSGGGGAILGSSVTLSVPATFNGNVAHVDGRGGAIEIQNGGSLTATDFGPVFRGNRALSGGAIAARGQVDIRNGVFIGNIAAPDRRATDDGVGGGIHIVDFSGVTLNLTDTLFAGNLALARDGTLNRGGAIFCEAGDAIINYIVSKDKFIRFDPTDPTAAHGDNDIASHPDFHAMLNKQGLGTLIFNNRNEGWNGDLEVQAGTFLCNGSFGNPDASSVSAFTVISGAAMGGSGQFNAKDITLNTGSSWIIGCTESRAGFLNALGSLTLPSTVKVQCPDLSWIPAAGRTVAQWGAGTTAPRVPTLSDSRFSLVAEGSTLKLKSSGSGISVAPSVGVSQDKGVQVSLPMTYFHQDVRTHRNKRHIHWRDRPTSHHAKEDYVKEALVVERAPTVDSGTSFDWGLSFWAEVKKTLVAVWKDMESAGRVQ